MSYKLDGVFNSYGTELSSLQHQTSIVAPTAMEYDGRYMWVTAATGIAIYEWWGAASDHEPDWETLDELVTERYGFDGDKTKLRLVTFISTGKRSTILESLKDASAEKLNGKIWFATTNMGSLSPAWIKKCAGKMYVANGANFNSVFEFDIQRQSFIRTIDLGVGTCSNLAASNAKLWFADAVFSDTVLQKLYSYDPVTNTKTATDIPVRPSLARTWITTGYNGSVYVTNYNNVSISRFSDTSGEFQKTIRVNAEPTHIFSGPDRRIWVSSFGGMLSLIDYDDDEVHNDFSTGVGDTQRAVGLATDPSNGSKVWFVNADMILARQDLNTKEQIESAPRNTGPIFDVETSKPMMPKLVFTATSPGTFDLTVNGKSIGGAGANGNRVVRVSDSGTYTFAVPKVIYNIGDRYEALNGQTQFYGAPVATEDWQFDSEHIAQPTTLMIVPPMYYQDETLTTHLIKPYLFILDAAHISLMRLENYIYRDVYATVNGQAAVAMGPQEYFGD